MEIYKIDTFGCSFYFLKGEGDNFSVPSGESAYAVRLRVSEKCDFFLEPQEEKDIFLPDLYRATQLFLTRVRGYPGGEYEIMTPKGKANLRLRGDGLCGGEVGRFSLLEKNRTYKLSGGEVSVASVLSPRGVYLLTHSACVENFDIEKLGSELSLAANGNFPLGVIALSGCDGRYDFRAFASGKEADSCAFAAAALYAREVMGEGKDSFSVSCGSAVAYVVLEHQRVSVFSHGSGVFRLFS